ncbi:tetratricopeptide repeat protein [Aliishimia ponticola]|uniref:Tetratricopeptide repeat protein 38 n=1 Tax=Aliishimia ponticola TaxID=2499833 RepID=A0A4S4N9V7_9RHOB|nr:tetratricopeptide repeat protein [Aliishimia ponticola]THH35979.1 tetratricopeptide repeat protein [Aliishimia ponticola]
MSHDICQSPVSLTTPGALSEWNKMICGFLAHTASTPTHLGAVLEAESDFAMGHAAKGLFSLMLGRHEMRGAAEDAYRMARTGRATHARERGWIDALGFWLAGRPSRAVAAMEDVLRAHPEDTLSAKVSHAIRFMLGDAAGMRRSVEAVLPAHEAHPLRGYLLGCHAFTLEETGDYAAAERAGITGLELAPDDAWGLHAVAHVYDMTAQPDRGIALIEDNCAAWDHCNNFRYHVWWHKALLHLDRNETALAVALYDQQIRADKTDDYRDIANASSLLMRLELEGVDVADRWDELADLSEQRTADGSLVFADLHYMLALGAAGRFEAASEMALRFTRDARDPGDMALRVADPGLAAMAGLHSFAEARWDTAFLNLSAARTQMQTVGGSHAQRDVFERMTIDAGLRAGFYDEVSTILDQRRTLRGGHDDRFNATRQDMLTHARRIPAQ